AGADDPADQDDLCRGPAQWRVRAGFRGTAGRSGSGAGKPRPAGVRGVRGLPVGGRPDGRVAPEAGGAAVRVRDRERSGPDRVQADQDGAHRGGLAGPAGVAVLHAGQRVRGARGARVRAADAVGRAAVRGAGPGRVERDGADYVRAYSGLRDTLMVITACTTT